MKTGGKAVLSSSFFSDSEIIQRKTSTAGETRTKTESQKPAFLSVRFMGMSPCVPQSSSWGALQRSAS